MSLGTSGQKCTFIKNETDKFTGNKVVKTGYQTLVPGFRVSVDRINAYTYLELVAGSMNVFSVDKGNEFIILFEDGSKLTLHNMKYTIADPLQAPGLTVWNAMLSFVLDDEAASELRMKPIASLRIYSNDGYFDGEVKTKNRRKIMDALKCLEIVQ